MEIRLKEPKQEFILLDELIEKIKSSMYNQIICFKNNNNLYIIKLKNSDEDIYECVSMTIQEKRDYGKSLPLKNLIRSIINNEIKIQIFDNNDDFIEWVQSQQNKENQK